MNSFDYLVGVVFSLVIVVLGMMFSRSGKNVKSFFAAGGQVPWWVSGLSLFMSFFSVGTFVVWGSIAYNSGFVSVAIQMTMAVSGIIIGCVIAPKWNKTGALTVAEFISDRLGGRYQRLYSIAFLVMNLFTAGAFLYPVGKIVEVSTGVPLQTAILVLGLAIIAYTALGGLWAVLVTDVLQFVVLTAAVVILVPLALSQVGGLEGFFSRLPEGFTSVTSAEYTPWFLVAFVVYNTVFIGGNWAYVQRYTSVSSPTNARKVAWMFAGLYMIAPVIWMLPPMIFRVIEPTLTGTESEDAYLMISKLVMPNGLLGLVLGAMVFATASSVNTTLNIAAGVFTNDIYGYFRRVTGPAEKMRVARLSTLGFGLLSISVALLVQDMGGIVEVVLSVAALTGAPLYLPPIWALFSKRQTGWSIFAASMLSLAVNAFFKFVTPVAFGISLNRTEEMILGVMAPVGILAAFELWFVVSNQPVRNTQADTHKRNASEVSEDEVASTSSDANLYAMKVLLTGIAVIGALIITVGCFAQSAVKETCIVGCLILLPSLVALQRLFARTRSVSN